MEGRLRAPDPTPGGGKGVQLVCVICSKSFTRPPRLAVRAKVCTDSSHVCRPKTVKAAGRRDRSLPCDVGCCRSKYIRGSNILVSGTLESRKYFSDQGELERILRHLKEAPGDVAITIRLIAACGLRVGEPRLIRMEDLALDAPIPHIMVPTLKRTGWPKRRVDLTPGLTVDLKKHFSGSSKSMPSSQAFPRPKITLQYWWNRIQKLAKVKERRSIHSLRHTHFTRLAEAGVDPKYSQGRAGWSSLEMYSVYAHVSDTMRKDVLGKMPKI